MVLVVIGHRGSSVTLARIDCEPGKHIKTHETTRPAPNAEDIEQFRRSPSTHLRFGFANPGEARVRGFTVIR